MNRRLLLLVAAVLVPALLAIGLLRSGSRLDRAPVAKPPAQHEARDGLVGGLDRWLGGALDPGPLSKAHASLAGVSECLECHGSASQVIDARCIACHEEIGVRAQGKVGWHGSFDQPCRSCHAEHAGADAQLIALDRHAFQHDLSRFKLRGAHLGADCDACHRVTSRDAPESVAFHFQGVPSQSCTGCHVDPHGGGPRAPESLGPIRAVSLDEPAPAPAQRATDHPISGRDCSTCHRETGFRAAQLRRDGFDHRSDTLFELRGAHRSVACDSCHTPERREHERDAGLAPGRGADPDCATCHDDPHRGAMKAANGCRSCHSETGWRQGFDHGRDTRFPLDDLHARLDCSACHSDQRFRAQGRDCQACHQDAAQLLAGRFGDAHGEPDPHAEGVACADCHRPTAAANRPVALGKRCAECHTPEYAGLLATWTSKLDALAGETPLDAALAERLRRSGVHNFAFARARLAAPRH